MKQLFRKSLPLLSAGALLSSLLTACPQPQPVPPPTSPTFNLSFSYPAQADLGIGLTLAAYTYSGTGKVIAVSGYGGYPSPYGPYSSPIKAAASPVSGNYNLTSLSLGGYALDNLLLPGGTDCRSFKPPQDAALGSITVTPADAKTCYVYFVAYTDSNRNGLPESSEVRYMTHDVLSYADKDFTYSGASANGKLTTTGNVSRGWTVLRHLVLQPSSAPGQYRVSMTSLPTEDLGIAIQMHEPSPFLTSMGLTSMSLGGLNAGGAK